MKTTKPARATIEPSIRLDTTPTTMPSAMSASPMPRQFPPGRVTAWTESGIGVSGAPQFGHTVAWSETSLLHPVHLMRAMRVRSYAPVFFLARSNFSASAPVSSVAVYCG